MHRQLPLGVLAEAQDLGPLLRLLDLGLWLTGLFGNPTSSDNGDGSFDHEFASGGEDLPSYTLEVGMPKPKLAVEGPGGVQASFDVRGANNDVAGRMLTVTLTNDLDGTVYG